MKAAILTGFEVFGKYTVNPTETLARSLGGEVVAGHLIRSMVFPTTVLAPHGEVDVGNSIVDESFLVDASVIISFGIASEARGVRIERTCTNWVENAKYCTPFENKKPLSGVYVPKERLLMPLQSWDLATLSEKLAAAGIPLETSEDAGSYCCNALMYRTLRSMKECSLEIPFIFVHVPCTEEAVANMPGFDRSKKVLFRQETLVTVVESLLGSYLPKS
jgi:pyroglutamyl-peptidase